jgi:hypothetical protein
MQANAILIGKCSGDSALSVLRVGFGEFSLGETEHSTEGREFDGGAHASDTSTNNDEVRR